MKIKKLLPICLSTILISLSGCDSTPREYNTKKGKYLHSYEDIDSPYKDVLPTFDSKQYSSPIVLDEKPAVHELPSNYVIPENNRFVLNRIFYYGVYHDYDVFSWDDDNAGWNLMHGFRIDSFDFFSPNYIILVCFPHSTEQTSFYDINDNQVTLSKKAIPFTYLYANGVFTLEDVKTICLERMVNLGDYEVEDNKYIFKVKKHEYEEIINQGALPFEIEYVNYGDEIDSNLFKKVKDKPGVDIADKNDAIYFGNYNGYEVFMPLNNVSGNYGLATWRDGAYKYLPTGKYLSAIKAYKDGGVYDIVGVGSDNPYWIKEFGDNHLLRIALQAYTYSIDACHLEYQGDEQLVEQYRLEFIDDWTRSYQGRNQESMRFYNQ